MKKLPSWLAYAAKIKEMIELMEARGYSKESCRTVMRESHATAQSEHDYPGSADDWEYIVGSPRSERLKIDA